MHVHVCCAQLWYTIRYRTILKPLRLIIHTIIIAYRRHLLEEKFNEYSYMHITVSTSRNRLTRKYRETNHGNRQTAKASHVCCWERCMQQMYRNCIEHLGPQTAKLGWPPLLFFYNLHSAVAVTSSTKPEVHNILHCRRRKTERAMTTVYMYRTFGEVWACSFWDMRADRQTDRHTGRNTPHVSRGEVLL